MARPAFWAFTVFLGLALVALSGDAWARKPRPKAGAPGESVSLGEASRGWLVDGVQLEDSPLFRVRDGRNWGTEEMVRAIKQAGASVQMSFKTVPQLVVGDLSRRRGGRFRPHLSHQSGRDADIGYYFKDGRVIDYLARASKETLDIPRTWAFLHALITEGVLELGFVDYRLQSVLYAHARDVAKVPASKLRRWFAYPQGRRRKGVILRHLRGHSDHMHLRFYAPKSIARAGEWLKTHGAESLKPLPRMHKVRRGQTLGKIAKKYRCKISELKRWNRGKIKRYLRVGQRLVVGWAAPELPTASR